MISIKNSTVNFSAKSSYAAADCADKAAAAPKLSLLNVANNRALVSVHIPNLPGLENSIEAARELVKNLFEDFHYDATDAESKLLGVTEVVVKSIDLMPVNSQQYMAWVVYAGVEIEEPEIDTEIPGAWEWATSRGIAAR